MQIIDLTIGLDNDTISPPSQAKKVDVSYVHRTPGWWQASWISLSPHTGTHMDSPLHVIRDAPKIGEIELERVIGEAIILDLTEKKANSAITADDLKKFNDDIKEGDIIILRTDWTDKKWGTDEYWNDSPYLTLDAAKWIVTKKPKAIAFDFFEEYSARLIDFKPDDFIVHKELLGSNIIIIEHLIHLNKIKTKRVNFFAIPLKIMVTEASPARTFVILE